MSKYIKLKDRVREGVVLPPAPTLIVGGTIPETYPKECVRCGRTYETTLKVEALDQCRECWHPKKPRNMLQSRFTLRGLRCKIKPPR